MNIRISKHPVTERYGATLTYKGKHVHILHTHANRRTLWAAITKATEALIH